ncbi:hypothetical protein [Nonomuraea typhae]|uniref:hypothetical protein n=1 Tax=Nonomuraea typhae TaxID=2603600 RepID=UPI0012F870C5|nr:hypothetical protein [Nonomuraea typhae]
MEHRRFRIVTVALDDKEEVREITAIVRSDTHKVITELVGDVAAVPRGSDGAELTVALPVETAIKLFRTCGQMTGRDPHHEHSSAIYDSLGHIYFGLIEVE